jgi:hypothetical protein
LTQQAMKLFLLHTQKPAVALVQSPMHSEGRS